MEEDMERSKETMNSLEDEHQRVVVEKDKLVRELAVCYEPQLSVQRVLSSTSFGWHFDRGMIETMALAEVVHLYHRIGRSADGMCSECTQ